MITEKITHKLPSLDGWRAVSIALVLLSHSSYAPGFPAAATPMISQWFDTGQAGVRFFFVISGFLITYLLIKEQAKTGGINLKKFYIRRALRILPVYFVYLLVLGAGTKYLQSSGDWAANLTFTTNFIGTPFATEHLWSLGVEEQFYLLWPWFVFFLLKRQTDAVRLLRVLAVPIVAGPVMRLLACKGWYPAGLQPLFGSGSFFMHFDALAYGCAGAVLFTHWRQALEAFYLKHFGRLALAGLLLILVPVGFYGLHVPARVVALFADSAQAFGFSLLLLQSVMFSGRGLYRTLNWGVMRHLGILSYSLYIWQQMFCGTSVSVFGRADAWWTSFPVWILTALVVAHASYYLMERPLLGLRAKFRAGETAVATGLATTGGRG